MDIVISGVDLYTPVGADDLQSYGAIRAGLSRLGETGAVDRRERPRIAGTLPDATHRDAPERLARLAAGSAARALLDARVPDSAPIAIVVCRPGEPRPDAGRTNEREWKAAFTEVWPGRRWRLSLVSEGAAAFASGLLRAEETLQEGEVEAVLLGAADSWLWLPLLRWLENTRRLKTETRPDGLIPGEAAGFVVLQRTSVVRRPLARVVAAASALEPGHFGNDVPCRSEGYTRALREALRNGGEAPARTLLSDMNGESLRAREWAVAEIRCLSETPRAHLHAADCTGDVGTVAGVLGLAIGALGLSRGELESPALVVAGGDGAPRGVALLAGPEGVEPVETPASPKLELPEPPPARPESAGLRAELARDHLEEAGFLLIQRRALEAVATDPPARRAPFDRRAGWHLIALARLAQLDPAPFVAAVRDAERETSDRAEALAALALARRYDELSAAAASHEADDNALERWTLEALVELPARTALESAAQLLRQEPPWARRLGGRLQARLTGDGASLLPLLDTSQRAERAGLIAALAEASDPRSAAALAREVRESPEEALRIASLRALVVRGDEALAALLSSGPTALALPVAWRAWARAWLGDAGALPELVRSGDALTAATRVHAAAVGANVAARDVLLEQLADPAEAGALAACALATLTGVDLHAAPPEGDPTAELEFSRDTDAWREVWRRGIGDARGAVVRGRPWDAARALRRWQAPGTPNGVRRLIADQLRARSGTPWRELRPVTLE
ncbi:MAG TPA: hypothetical protein VMI75_12575 [Polyangiaceae bacterium]|nr:hypothetical protein [Polyangiaceae bacterium]